MGALIIINEMRKWLGETHKIIRIHKCGDMVWLKHTVLGGWWMKDRSGKVVGDFWSQEKFFTPAVFSSHRKLLSSYKDMNVWFGHWGSRKEAWEPDFWSLEP